MAPDRIARALTPVAVVLLAGALLAGDASAHAHLASTTPRDSAVVRTAPSAVVLRFTRPVDARTAVLRVVDERGTPLPVTTSAGAEGVVRVALRRALADGDYAVGYRVLATDGHAMRGGVAFSVAAGPASGARATPAATSALVGGAVPRDAAWTQPALVASRAGQYAGLVLTLGGVSFLLLAWWPATAAAGRGRDDPAASTWSRTLASGVTIGAVSAATGLAAHAFDAAGAQPTAARVTGGLGDPAAILWAEATACWLVAGVMLRRRAPLEPRTAKRLLAPLAGALLATALSGHGGSDGDLTAAAAAIAHGTAAAIWIGALAWLMLAARRGADSGQAGQAAQACRAAIVPGAAARVSRLSLAAAVATLASGTVQAIALAGGPLTLAGSSYGRLVLAKLALFAGLVALGTRHRRRTLPALRGTAAASRPLRATLRAELAIAALVLATAGVLTGSTPPRPADATPPALAAER